MSGIAVLRWSMSPSIFATRGGVRPSQFRNYDTNMECVRVCFSSSVISSLSEAGVRERSGNFAIDWILSKAADQNSDIAWGGHRHLLQASRVITLS